MIDLDGFHGENRPLFLSGGELLLPEGKPASRRKSVKGRSKKKGKGKGKKAKGKGKKSKSKGKNKSKGKGKGKGKKKGKGKGKKNGKDSGIDGKREIKAGKAVLNS